jgi:UDP-glucose 4-epimerase
MNIICGIMSKKLVVVTGGCGYIGSHTIIQLLNSGFNVVSIDNLSRSTEISLDLVHEITNIRIKNYNIDLCNSEITDEVFSKLGSIFGVIHFAAFKSVPESVNFPEKYYSNNTSSLVNVLSSCIKNSIRNFVFSSSCSVYGDIKHLPVSENTPLSEPKSPYAATKIIGEQIMKDICCAHSIKAMCLRYFNPVGAHTSGLLGEMPLLRPENLIPVITQTAIGKRTSFEIFGGNLDTRDGSCVRDYVHVMDIADAHVLALQRLGSDNFDWEIINLGSGKGVSVFEAIRTFEKVSGIKLKYTVGSARTGDVIEIYSNVDKAKKLLGWKPNFDISEMISSAWKWELELFKREQLN